MRIAICDDEVQELEIITVLLAKKDNSIIPDKYTSADTLLSSSLDYDLILMDIEMDGITGFDAAKIIKKRKPGKFPIIIFLTKSREYVYRGYGIAYRYITKPIDPDIFDEAIRSAFDEVLSNNYYFEFDGSLHAIKTTDIIYIESFGHYAVLHTNKAELKVRLKLNDILSKLPKSRFSKPHKSYIVNLEYIRREFHNELELTNGALIPISRNCRAQFNTDFNLFLGR